MLLNCSIHPFQMQLHGIFLNHDKLERDTTWIKGTCQFKPDRFMKHFVWI